MKRIPELPLKLTDEEAHIIFKALADFPASRPTPAQYGKVDRVLRKIPWKCPASIEGAYRVKCDWPSPCMRRKPTVSRVVPPPGTGLFPLYDSAGTMSVHRAGNVLWTHLWNMWSEEEGACERRKAIVQHHCDNN